MKDNDIAKFLEKIKNQGNSNVEESVVSLTAQLISNNESQEKLSQPMLNQYIDIIQGICCNAAIIEKVIDLINGLKTQKNLSESISRLIQITLEKMRQLHNMSSAEGDLKAMDNTMKLKYLALQLSLLKTLTATDSSVKIHLKDIVECFTSTSTFFSYMTSQYEEAAPVYFEITSIFIKLSISVKTVHRLIFLITAAHYSIYTGSPRRELFTRIAKEGQKMIKKSRIMVYKFTNTILRHLITTCKEKSVDISILDDLLREFEKEAPVQRKTNEKLNSKELVKPLNNMSLSSKFSPLQVDSQSLMQNLEFLDFNTVEDLKFAHDFILSLSQENTNYQAISYQLDIVMRKLKCIQIDIENSVLVHTIIDTLIQFFIKVDESKRLKNCSKLCFYHGNKLLEENPIISLSFWKSFIFCEKQLSSNDEDLQITQKRLNFILSKQIEASNFEIAIKIQLLFIDISLRKESLPLEYLTLLNEKYAPCINIISKCVTTEPSLLSTIFELVLNESLVIAINLALVECLEKIGTLQKEKLISTIIVNQKEKIKDNGLFLHFLSKVSLIVSFPISFNIGATRFHNDSCVFQMEPLIMSHLLILQTFTNTVNVLQTILKSYYLALEWLKSDMKYSHYEYRIIEFIIQTLRYHELFNYSNELINLFLTNRRKHFSESELTCAFSMLLDCQIKLDQYELCESTIDQNNYYLKTNIETLEDMEFALNTLKYTVVSQSDLSSKLMKKINNTFKTNECFSIATQKEQHSAVKLLFLHAKFCQIVGESWDSTNIRSVANFGRSITILQSIFKNFLLPGSYASTLNICFKYILKMNFSYMMLECYNSILQKYSCLGFAKEFNYYLNELSVFISIQPSQNLQYSYNIKLMEFNLLRNSIDKAAACYQKVRQLYDTIICDDNILIQVDSLVAIENYARKSKDIRLALTATQKLDNIIFNILKSKLSAPSRYHIAINKWIEAIKRRYQYICEGDLDDYKLVVDENIMLYVEYHNFLKDMQEKATLGSVCYYPLIESGFLDSANNEDLQRLKACNDMLFIDFKKSLNKDSVEMAKYTLDMIITYFVNILNFNKKVKMHEELTNVVSVNDSFKYASFLSEKANSLINFQKNVILPEITNDNFRGATMPSNLSCNLGTILPENWSIITIDYISSMNSLMITKQAREFEKPLFINIMLDLPNEKNSYENITLALKNIIEESDRTTHFNVTSQIKTVDQKIEWWETRKTLDSNLEKLLVDIDEHWFGGFNSIFLTSKGSTEQINLVRKCIKSMLYVAHLRPEVIDDVDNIHPGIFELFLNIEDSTIKMERLLKFLLQTLDQDYAITDQAVWEKALLHLKQNILNITSYQKDSKNEHIVLIPGNGCLNIPWESIPSLRKKSVTRMPTLLQLKKYLTQYKYLIDNGINSDKGYYVINPGGDLKRTEENLAPKFKYLDGWNGVVGTAPTEAQLMHAFDTAGLYIYAGHGGGEQFVKSKLIKARNKIPPTLLLGCSSGALKGEGFVYPYGTAYNYIMGGCPMLLVNLWDVTDKDIDTFTVETLTRWGFFVDYESLDPFDLNATSETLPESVAKSRDICKLKYLNGAAPIIYGLPLRLESN